VIWRYNRSDAYVATVLAIAAAIERPAPVKTAARCRRPPARHSVRPRPHGAMRATATS
jgi:hypothetical protein